MKPCEYSCVLKHVEEGRDSREYVLTVVFSIGLVFRSYFQLAFWRTGQSSMTLRGSMLARSSSMVILMRCKTLL